jgi:anthranilate phosphoribosyltransferase
MKHVAAVRKKLGTRTIFNILGPLANPAGACYQLLGAGRPDLRPLLAGAMARLGTKRTLVVSGEDGLGDVTLAAVTNVSEVSSDAGSGHHDWRQLLGSFSVTMVKLDFTWTPEDFGLSRQPLTNLAVDSPAASAKLIRGVLAGERGPARDIVLLNAAAGLIAAEKVADPRAAATTAAAAIDSGAARELLAQLVECSNRSA